ncbi:L-Ala-D/L-amino acid epimerase isoform X1 [Juglans microcarpa x Juglans regia]|uniref:L-Ala-D/L-amino acid epimerase isoform X1 n=1 Tax=Juglans microcarpa x Juglans regia TaxID=2249226 RepID=UPI001B7F1D98|nr:L-Ala-D/L-amino acid epimerase isoform X1 [Juglans microcarpa x Juglans regia]
MLSTGLSLFSLPRAPILCSPLHPTETPPKSHPFSQFSSTPTKKMAATTPIAITTSFGLKNLMETFTVDVQRAENRPLNVPLIAPFTISSSRLERVENVAIRIELRNGCVGWGEAPILPFVTVEDQSTAMSKAAEACEFLKRSPAMTMGLLLAEIDGILPGHEFASVRKIENLALSGVFDLLLVEFVRAGVEMAVIDAVATSIGVPLWRLFGGVSNTITTDITIPIVSPAEAAELAAKYYNQGFNTLKLKVGKNLKADIEVLQAIRGAHPECLFILDANEGYKPTEAIEVLEKLHEMGVTPVLFEQPVHRDDWEGLGHVNRIAKNKYGVSVAADESCRSLVDVKKIVRGNLADVVNIKLAKVGVVGALEIIEIARASGLHLMIGGMVETRLAMGFAGHLAAGLGCFKFVDLDTPLLLSEDPVLEGYEVSGAVYKFTNARGHGGFLHWDNIA